MKKSFTMLVIGMAGLCWVSGAGATATLTIDDGVDPKITLTDNGLGDLATFGGAVLAITNVGAWNLTIASGLSKPEFGTSTFPVMDIDIQASSTGAGTLEYTFSDNDFLLSFGTINVDVSGQLDSGAPATVGYGVYGDPANDVGARTIFLAGTGTSPLPVLASSSGPLNLAAPYSLTEDITLTASGASTISIDASLQVIPEPSTLALMVIGLSMLFRLRRRHH